MSAVEQTVPTAQATTQERSPWRRERDDLIRGVSGGFLFGIPLLYTMEVWWIGSLVAPAQMLVALAATFIAVLLLNHTAGFRRTEDTRIVDAAIDSVETLALGIVCAGLVLVLLREITAATPLDEALGKIIFESVPFSLGVAVANQLLSGRGDDEAEPEQAGDSAVATKSVSLDATIADIGATTIGAVFIAFNIAPTEEIPMLAAALSPPWLLLIVAASLLISYGIVFEAGFTRQERRVRQQGPLQQPLTETIAAYLVSVLTAAVMLWFFQQLSPADPWPMWLSYALLLGLPASVGGAAGRLAI